MRKEIGSFFEAYEMPELSTSKYEGGTMWWDTPNMKLVCSGREAIEAAVIDIEYVRPELKKVCVLPQYTCDTVVIPFQKHGWRTYFYPIARDFAADYEIFEKLLMQTQPDVLLMHTYYGVDTIENVRPLIAEWRRKYGLIFIEDMTQSLGLWNSGDNADYYVGSLRKWLPTPDGGFIYSGHDINVELCEEKRVFVEKKRAAQKLKLQFLNEMPGVKKEEILNLNSAAEKYLYENDKISAVSEDTKKLLRRIDVWEILHQRKENAVYLKGLLSQSGKFKVSINAVESGPLYLPIYTEKRAKLQQWLKEANIFAPVLWPKPNCVESTMSEDVRFIFSNLLALPCDQRYCLKDMKLIFDRLCSF